MSTLSIENKQWSVKNLNDLLPNIIKPKFQRKKRWTIKPAKSGKKRPSYSEYIKFLYTTKNSIDVLSFGTLIKDNRQIYMSIDGNNRLNAIIEFIRKPLAVYSDIFKEEIKFLLNYITLDILESLSYDDLCDFRRLIDLKTITAELEAYSREQYVEIEEKLIQIQNGLRMTDGTKFTECVKVNINIFSNGTYEEYNDIFSSINTHTNALSENELLASILYSNKVTLGSDSNSNEIVKNIEEFYSSRDENEVLFNVVKIDRDSINIFDYMVGLQNMLSKLSNGVIEKYESDKKGLIFTLYKIIYNITALDSRSFNKLDTKCFTDSLVNVASLLKKIVEEIFSDKLKSNKLFGSKRDIRLLFKQGNVIVLCSSILSLVKSGENIDFIIKNVKKSILFHMFIKSTKLVETHELEFKTLDTLNYVAGGQYIENMCKKIYEKEPSFIFSKLDRTLFKNLLDTVVYNNIKPSKNSKRRDLNSVHKILYSTVFKRKVPIEWLDKHYSIEHIIPVSSKYDKEIDINRVGNLFPIPIDYNTKRGNRHISNYKTICKDYYDSFIVGLCSIEEYGSIIKYECNSPIIKDIDKYNEMCEKNENYYIEFMLDYLF